MNKVLKVLYKKLFEQITKKLILNRYIEIEIQQLCKEPDIVAVLKYRRMIWASHLWRSVISLMNMELKWKHHGKIPFYGPKNKID